MIARRCSLTAFFAFFAATIALALVVSATGAAAASFEVDATFGKNGTTILGAASHGRDYVIKAVAARPGGGWIAVGHTDGGEEDYDSDYRWAVLAFRADGTLDTTFGNKGKLTDFDPGRLADRYGSVVDAVAIQPDGKILVGGVVDNPTAKDEQEYLDGVGGEVDCQCFASRGAFLVARLRTNGKLDKSFGTHGYRQIRAVNKSWTENGPMANLKQLVVAPDGHIYVLGDSMFYSNGLLANPRDRNRLIGFALSKNGSIDRSFGSNGRMLAAIGAKGHEFYPSKFVWMKGGGIAVVGETIARRGKAPATQHMVVARITSRGRLNRSWLGTGWKESNLAPIKTYVASADVDENGAATFVLQKFRGSSAYSSKSTGVLVARISENASMPKDFGNNGVVDVTGALGPNHLDAGELVRFADGSIALQTSTGKDDGISDSLVPISSAGAVETPSPIGFPNAPGGIEPRSKMISDGSRIVLAGLAAVNDDWRPFIGRLRPVTP